MKKIGMQMSILMGVSLSFCLSLVGSLWGLNNYRSLYFEGEYSHNNFIELMVCLGLVGLVLYYTMYAIPIIRTARMVKRKDPRIEDTHLILLFMLVISFVFGYGMVQFYGKGAWMLIGVALAMVTRFKQESRWIV
jgi:O-antigen ligase